MGISSVVDKLKDGAVRLLLFFGITIICLIPTWIYLLARFVFEPDNALVEIVLFGVALYFLGALQLILAGIGLYLIFTVILVK